jgi:hypothetical protein
LLKLLQRHPELALLELPQRDFALQLGSIQDLKFPNYSLQFLQIGIGLSIESQINFY